MADPVDGGSSEFSVLLPVYANDHPDHFGRAYESATTDQTLRPSEVVVVVDGPVGDALTAELDRVADHPVMPARVVRLPTNRGLARALEEGLRHCSHEIVARADADDVSRPDRFAAQVPLVAGGLDLVGSAIVEFVDDERVLGMVRTPPLDPRAIAAYARFHDPFNHPSVVYRRSAVAAAGGYRDLPLMEDYWLFARMIAGGARVANLPEPLVLYRVGAGAYARRGGWPLLRSELTLQRRLRSDGFTTAPQYLRNVTVRGGYRLVPERVRRVAYRRLVVRRGDPAPRH